MVLETHHPSFRLQLGRHRDLSCQGHPSDSHSHLLQLFPLYDASTPNRFHFVFFLPRIVRFVQGSTKANSITVQTCRQTAVTSLEELYPFSARNHCTVA